MSHLLWKHYTEHDVDKFRRLLGPAGQNGQAPTKSSGVNYGSSWGHSASFGGSATPPRAFNKSRKVSGLGPASGSSKGNTATGMGKAEINARDHMGLTLLLHAASSHSELAIEFISALLDHPALDLYAQDFENGWNALHRALYAGNISIARLLLEKERKILIDQTPGASVNKVGQLIKTKDREGNSPFDLYNSTVAWRDLKTPTSVDEGADDDDDDQASVAGSDAASLDDPVLSRTTSTLAGAKEGEEVFVFGSNKNLSLGVGDEDDRQFPERIHLVRPDHLLQRFHDEYLHHVSSSSSATPSERPGLDDMPALTRFRPMKIKSAVLSKFHSAILTTDPVSNLHVSGIGRSGRLGLGDENTQFRFRAVQGGLADKKVAQVALGLSHTVALTDNGELWTWGSNGSSQLGYTLPPARQDEEPMSTTPRQVFGPLKKEYIAGIAASAIHSVAHTGSSLFCWGKNVGQLGLMDADSRSLEIQPTPRKVAASLFSASILAVSAIDKATTCLLDDSSVCVFTSYGYNFVKFSLPDVFANQQFTPAAVASKTDSRASSIQSITSGGETIAALTASGHLFTFSLNERAEATPAATSTTNPSKIKGALTTPQCVWNAQNDGVRSVGVGEHGSVIICTESGAIWRRVKRAKAKDAGPNSADKKRNVFKFQRVPSVTNAVAVSCSTFGTFAAIRKDSDIVRQQIHVAPQTLRKDLAPLLPLRGFQASEASSRGKDHLKLWNAESLAKQLGDLPFQLLKSPDLDKDLTDHLLYGTPEGFDCDVLLASTHAPEIKVPVHGWLLAARSPILRKAFAEYSTRGEYQMPETLSMEECEGQTLITFQSLDLLSLANLVVYCYDDTIIPAWNFARQAPPLAFRYRQVRTEVMKLASKLNMMELEAAARLQVPAKNHLTADMRNALEDPAFFEDADAVVDLNGEERPVHSQLLRQRCDFFEGLFFGRSRGMWLAGRGDPLIGEERVRIDLQHVDPEVFDYVLRYLYADVGPGLFDDAVYTDLDDFYDLVMRVMSIANELMLDRLSQTCQQVLGRFVTSRNLSMLLNEISPCTIDEFKVAGLEYACLQMENMLENHHLDDLDEDLLLELDKVVFNNQQDRNPISRNSEGRLLALMDADPHLVFDIEEERKRRIGEMAFKSLRRSSKAPKTDAFSPVLRPKGSQADLIFDMDDEASPPAGSPFLSPQRGGEPSSLPRMPSHLAALQEPTEAIAIGTPQSPESSLPKFDTPPHRGPLTPSSKVPSVSKEAKASQGSPWGSTALPTAKLSLRDVLSATPPKSALSVDLAAQQSTKESSPRPSQPKISQKERKKQQQAAAAAQAAEAAEAKKNKVAWDTQNPAGQAAAPWKLVTSKQDKTSLMDVMKETSKSPQASGASAPARTKPLVAAEAATSKSVSRRTASPDTRFSGQGRVSSSPSVPTASSNSASRAPPMPHSKSYITPTAQAEPVLGLSMSDIIGQQKRERESVKEAVAKRSMQEIQQEQEFQQWWDQESRRIQEEEARRAAKGKVREEKNKTPGGGGSGSSGRGGKRGRGRGRPEKGGEGSASSPAVGDRTPGAKDSSKSSRGRGGNKSRGGKAST